MLDSCKMLQKQSEAFKLLGFKIEISSNNKIVNFLDVTIYIYIYTFLTTSINLL